MLPKGVLLPQKNVLPEKEEQNYTKHHTRTHRGDAIVIGQPTQNPLTKSI